MKHRKNSIILLLAAIMTVSSATACNQQTTETGTVEVDTVMTEETEETEGVPDNLPEKDWGGREFRIEVNPYYEQYFQAELSGDVLSDAIYQRDLAVEERFNVDLVNTFASENAYGAIYAGFLSGDSICEVNVGNGTEMAGNLNLDTVSAYLDYYMLPYVDFEQPWWNPELVDDISINGKMFVGFPMLTYHNISGIQSIVLNTDIMKDWNVSVPYEQVKNGNWLFDDLIEMTKNVYEDVNGNGLQDKKDIYGFTCYAEKECWAGAFGAVVVAKDENGYLSTAAVDQDRLVAIVEKMYDFYFNYDGMYITHTVNCEPDSWTSSNDKFVEGSAMGIVYTLAEVGNRLRDVEFNYALLPIPKWNDSQKNYYCNTDTHCGVLIPSTGADLEFLGMIIEGINSATYEKVIPAYYEVTLQNKILRNEEDMEMLEIIRKSGKVWRDQMYTSSLGGILGDLMHNESTNFASAFASVVKAAQTDLEKWNTVFGK